MIEMKMIMEGMSATETTGEKVRGHRKMPAISPTVVTIAM
jgi:hypothetical protein